MSELVLLAAVVALLALAALAIRAYFLVRRAHQFLDQVGRLVEEEVRVTLGRLAETARGVEKTVGKLDEGLSSLASTLARVDRLGEKLEPESLARTIISPAVGKITSWIAGVRRGMRSVRARKERGGPETGAGEAG
jgi:hypothetical protein